ncbi:MAG: 2-oxo acid dehydrogenase subunit E2, partial [Ktedonobacterales bacterium]
EEFQGGTFSVSNLGMFGVDEFTAIINPPESAILAVGAIVPTPVVRNAQVVVRDLMKVTLSVDHRALDGAVAARFLQELKRLLEQPMAMLV